MSVLVESKGAAVVELHEPDVGSALPSGQQASQNREGVVLGLLDGTSSPAYRRSTLTWGCHPGPSSKGDASNPGRVSLLAVHTVSVRRRSHRSGVARVRG
jgi:hypothetical protein